MPEKVGDILTAIHKRYKELGETVASKKLQDVHHLAFAIRDLAKPLPEKVPLENKVRVQGTVNNIATLAASLDESGDAGDQTKTEANLKKLDGLLKLLESQVSNS